jgi:hypothetical protein
MEIYIPTGWYDVKLDGDDGLGTGFRAEAQRSQRKGEGGKAAIFFFLLRASAHPRFRASALPRLRAN